MSSILIGVGSVALGFSCLFLLNLVGSPNIAFSTVVTPVDERFAI